MFRVKCTLPRCQQEPGKDYRIAATNPFWAAETIREGLLKPRSFSFSNNCLILSRDFPSIGSIANTSRLCFFLRYFSCAWGGCSGIRMVISSGSGSLKAENHIFQQVLNGFLNVLFLVKWCWCNIFYGTSLNYFGVYERLLYFISRVHNSRIHHIIG